MITLSKYAGQSVGVFGLGKAGAATVQSLLAGGAKVFAWDDKNQTLPAHDALTVQPYSDWPWQKIKALVLSPGIPLTHPTPHPVVDMATRHNCPIIGDIELLYRAQPNARYVAITGTNGKSTTTALVAHIIKECGVNVQVGGNLGTAALSLEPLGADGVYVLELSSYQLDLLRSTRFTIAAFLNLTPDHLDRHGSMQGYLDAKMHIFDRQKADDLAVVAVDDDYTRAITTPGRLLKVSCMQEIKDGVYYKDGWLIDGDTRFDLRAIPTLPGQHNGQNAAVAYGIARGLGLAPGAIYSAMKTFPGLRHRLQIAGKRGEVLFVNDSKATNADAASHALAAYDNIYWIAGGVAKEGGIAPLEKYFPRIRHAFLIGAAQEAFAKTLDGKLDYTRCDTLDVAVAKAAQMAKDGVVLLSPACASFDQWPHFEARGDAFCTMVEELTHAA